MAVIAVKDEGSFPFDPAEMLPVELCEPTGGCVKHDADSPKDRRAGCACNVAKFIQGTSS
jgi:hypothetical protein